MRIITAAIPIVLSLCGCLGKSPGVPSPPVSQALSPAAQFIADSAPGSRATITDQSFGGQVHIHVEEPYLSATGRECKRGAIGLPIGGTEIIVLCRESMGWEMIPRIWGVRTD